MITQLTASALHIAAGTVLAGKYQVTRLLGSGGMGVVYEARDLVLDRKVAMKFLQPAVAANPEVATRFLREGRAVVALTSEHVAQVYDVGADDRGSSFLVMEYLDGQDLGSLVEKSGPLDPRDAVDYVLQASTALAEAHALGIIHRDLKPANLFLTHRADGSAHIKVLDFGISKLKVPDGSGVETKTGVILGSPGYMSPEQLQSARGVDARADIWSLGVVLYHLVSGRLPFEGQTFADSCHLVLSAPPRPLDASVPSVLREVIARCLEKAPQERYPHIAALAAALARLHPSRHAGTAERIARVLKVTESAPTSGRSNVQPLPSLVGEELAGFRLVSLVGQGGMAAVFRGENLLDATIVRAIKVVRPELASQPEFARRFAEEARILEKLQHPNVVRFYGARRDRDYLVMELEFLDGESLSRLLASAKGPVGLSSVITWLHGAAEGVAVAHELGIVHRDLKPDNVLVTRRGEVKVLDFGIARAIDEADRANRATTAGTVPGSPAYMAPEVCNGAVPTPAADVYALGMCAYELLLGHHPLMPPGEQLKSSTQIMFAQVSTELQPIRDKRPEVPAALDAVVMRALAKQPGDRYPSGRDLANALHPLANAMPREATVHEEVAGTRFALPTLNASATTGGRGELVAQPASRRRGLQLGLGLLVAAGSAVAVVIMREGPDQPATKPKPATATAVLADAAAAPPTEIPGDPNPWVSIAVPATRVVLGVSAETTSDSVHGFRPARRVLSATTPYEIQSREVTWGELEPWLEKNPAQIVFKPNWLPTVPAERARLPATGVTWSTAVAYCKAIGGRLPTEEQWELAARGAERRPNPWGDARIDLAGTRVFGSADALPAPVATSDQDQTPEPTIYDLLGNAQEWTIDLWREDLPGQDESWVQEAQTSYRAVRGLPLRGSMPASLQAEGAAYREPLCATGVCLERARADIEWVGFRCVRPPRGVVKER